MSNVYKRINQGLDTDLTLLLIDSSSSIESRDQQLLL